MASASPSSPASSSPEPAAAVDWAAHTAKLRDGDLFARIQAAAGSGGPAGLAIAQLRDKVAATFR